MQLLRCTMQTRGLQEIKAVDKCKSKKWQKVIFEPDLLTVRQHSTDACLLCASLLEMEMHLILQIILCAKLWDVIFLDFFWSGKWGAENLSNLLMAIRGSK